MENILNSQNNRLYEILDKIEDAFMTVVGIGIGLSPLLVLL